MVLPSLARLDHDSFFLTFRRMQAQIMKLIMRFIKYKTRITITITYNSPELLLA